MVAEEDYSDKSILNQFSSLFYISSFFGITPYSTLDYFRNKKLKVSNIGILGMIASLFIFSVQYHLLMMLFVFGTAEKTSALTKIIGIVINYISPIMMAVDMIAWIKNRQKVIDLIDEFNDLDANLFKEQIRVKNQHIHVRINIMIATIFVLEIGQAIFMLRVFSTINWFWLVSCMPTVLNALDKVWFSGLLQGLKERFHALNVYIDQNVEDYIKLKKIRQNFEDENDIKNIGYLHKEIISKNISSNLLLASRNDNRIVPIIPWENVSIKDNESSTKQKKIEKFTIIQSRRNILSDINTLEDKLNKLCQLHDEMCELGKTLNSMWSIQMLLLMAYGFMSITAQFYFMYCALTPEQQIPNLFQSANDVTLSCVFVGFVASKCVYVIFLSWQTKLVSRHTGVCVHKIAVAIDENEAYEIVNHISLKLLNHCVSFSACGFFNLDMTTLYGVTGAITSYLIILIQFNIAGQTAKNNSPEATTSPVTSLATTTVN